MSLGRWYRKSYSIHQENDIHLKEGDKIPTLSSYPFKLPGPTFSFGLLSEPKLDKPNIEVIYRNACELPLVRELKIQYFSDGKFHLHFKSPSITTHKQIRATLINIIPNMGRGIGELEKAPNGKLVIRERYSDLESTSMEFFNTDTLLVVEDRSKAVVMKFFEHLKREFPPELIKDIATILQNKDKFTFATSEIPERIVIKTSAYANPKYEFSSELYQSINTLWSSIDKDDAINESKIMGKAMGIHLKQPEIKDQWFTYYKPKSMPIVDEDKADVLNTIMKAVNAKHLLKHLEDRFRDFNRLLRQGVNPNQINQRGETLVFHIANIYQLHFKMRTGVNVKFENYLSPSHAKYTSSCQSV